MDMIKVPKLGAANVSFQDQSIVSLRGRVSGYAALFGTALAFAIGGSSLHAAPVHLRTEGQVNPLGMDVPRPVLSWQSDAAGRDWVQSASR